MNPGFDCPTCRRWHTGACRPAPMDEVIRLAQEYKIAPTGSKTAERALLALCDCVEKIVHAEIVALKEKLNDNR